MGTTLEVSDLTKVYGTSDRLRARLLSNGTPLIGYEIHFKINGVEYTRTTDNNGYASLNINLGIGSYPTKVSYNNIVKNITVRVTDKKAPWLDLKNLVKTYGGSEQLKVGLYDDATPLAGKTIEFTINGRTYNRTTDNTGYASLNINLIMGVYQCEIRSISDSVYGQVSGRVTVTVKANTFVDGIDVVKKYSDPGYFQCAVYDPWQRVKPCSAQITVNGVTYTRSTDAEGLIKLNIRLQPGTYPITAKFLGDNLRNPSEVTKTVLVKPDIEEITTVTPMVSTPENNRGTVLSHIYHIQQVIHTEESTRKNEKYKLSNPFVIFSEEQWKNAAKNGWDLQFTTYEINETDPRVKTASVTTNHYFDLSRGVVHLCITNPFHENFAGQIIDVDFDKKTKLYTYKLQDGRRQYQSKRVVIATGNTDVYSILKGLLLSPAIYGTGKGMPNMAEIEKLYPQLISGLHPLKDYDNLKSGAIKFSNQFQGKSPQLLSYDSDMDKIMALAHMGGFPTDVYFDTNLICHIDPVDLDKWLNTGIRLRLSDLVEYKQSFNLTNIITGVNIKNPNSITSSYYDEWKELRWFFGSNISMVDPVTTQTQNNTNTAGSTTSAGGNDARGIMNGKKTFDVGQDSGIASDYRLDLIKALREKGHTVNDLGVGHSVVQNNGLRSSSKGHIGIFICNGICCGTHQDFLNGFNRGFYHYDHVIFTWVRGDIEMNRKQDYAHDWWQGDIGLDKSITRQDFFDKHADKFSDVNLWPNGDGGYPLSRSDWQKQVNALVNGQFNNNTGGAVSTANNSGGGTAGTTIINETATYKKALEEVSKSVRDLLSFELKVPLNSPVFKNLHTNMMLWTELPVEFPLANLEQIFKIMPVYKVSRGISSDYRVNRWYVEGVKTKCDSNGLFATIKLNPFPSSYSSYGNAVKSYMEAYDQAFNQKTTTNTSTTGGASPGTLVKSTGNSELDEKIKGWIAGKTSELDKAIAIHNGLKSYGIIYERYNNFPKSGGSISTAYKKAHAGLNCGDCSVLTVGSMRAAGLEAFIGFRCDHEHFFTVIVIDGTKYYSDLTGAEGARSVRAWNDTWHHNKCHTRYGGVNIH